MAGTFHHSLMLSSEEETARFASAIAPHLRAGDTILLKGGLGAGKTHFARALIQARLRAAGRNEEVPSPTYTLVQEYDDGTCTIWHCDLYRLSGVDDLQELGLAEAFETAITLIEWPDKLGPEAPASALTLEFRMQKAPGARHLDMSYSDPRWHAVAEAGLPVAGHG